MRLRWMRGQLAFRPDRLEIRCALVPAVRVLSTGNDRAEGLGTPGALTIIVSRASNHTAPVGLAGTARHYIGDLVYGANDGLVTTFAAVAGVEGGSLAPATVLIVGVANLVADGLSMGIGNFLSIRAREQAREADDLPEEESQPARHGMATFLSFVVAGAVPLLPYCRGH